MRFGHLSLTSRLTTYAHGLNVQNGLIQRHLDQKTLLSKVSKANRDAAVTGGRMVDFSELPPPPDPVILTLHHKPTYTVGRRELGQIPESQKAFLTEGGRATFHESPRGGQITFHCPGQLVVYPIIDLKRHRITPRCYIRLLESTVIATISRFGIKGITTDDPGVWLPGGEKKVASVGVNVRRGITGHGVAINVEDRTGHGVLGWGFGRIVACGLEGKEVTWLEKEGARRMTREQNNHNANGAGDGDATLLEVTDVERVFVEEFVKAIPGVEEVYQIKE